MIVNPTRALTNEVSEVIMQMTFTLRVIPNPGYDSGGRV